MDADPPLEFQASVSYTVIGFSMKHDSGKISVWARYDDNYLTAWIESGGPVIGFKYRGV